MDHELRHYLNDEVHGRPALPVAAPASVSHLAFTHSDDGALAAGHVAALCKELGAPLPPVRFSHHVIAVAGGWVKWERHGEFSTLTLAHETKGATGGEGVSPDWLAAFPGKRIVAVRVDIVSSADLPDDANLQRRFGPGEVAGSRVNGGSASVWTDFRIGPDGFTQVLLHAAALPPKRLGRLLRRILEIETYRMMALLAFPVAREVGPRLSEIEAGIGRVVAGLPSARNVDAESNLLNELTDIAHDIEVNANATGFRFAAAAAYDALVGKRLAELREERIEGYQRLQTFLDRRMGPAMATCRAAAARIDTVAQRVERASHLLRTRVDIVVERQNSQLLQSMESRARQQVKLQETVEGLSVVAISYYAIALLAKVAEGVAQAGPSFNVAIVEAALAPVVVLVVWFGLQRARGAPAVERPPGNETRASAS